MDRSFPSCAGWMCFVPFQLVNLAWMPEITCNLLLKEVGVMLHCCCVTFSEVKHRNHLPPLLSHATSTNVVQKHHTRLSVAGHLGMQVCSLSRVFFWVNLNLLGACKLQSKMAWNVDALVRYLAACLWRQIYIRFQFFLQLMDLSCFAPPFFSSYLQ